MFCTQCGHQLGIGRYCTNCGARVAESTSASDPDLMPSSARYPLFADTVQTPAPAPAPAPAPTPPEESFEPMPEPPPASRRSVLPWLLGLLVVAVIVVIGAALLVLAPSGDEDADDDAENARGDRRGNSSQSGDEDPGEVPGSRLAPSDVDVPATAPASVDGDGEPVTFTAEHLLDADPTTSWRMAGDGSGTVITFSFDDAVTVTQVGLVNGYAKLDPPHDWYAGNRRIAEVVWVFDDGTEVEQQLEEQRELQTVPVESVQTTTIELRIIDVTAPGEGPDARDYTAISDVEISGTK